MDADHRIQRLVFEMVFRDRATVWDLDGLIRSSFDTLIAPAIEAALDGIARTDTWVRLDRVEVDLGSLDPLSLTPEQLARRIGAGLATALEKIRAPEPTERAKLESGDVTAADAAVELAAFLETGELPWSEPGSALQTLATAILALDAVSMRRLAARLRTLLVRRRASERLVRQLPVLLVGRLLRSMLPEGSAASIAAELGPDRAVDVPSIPTFTDDLVPLVTEVSCALAAGALSAPQAAAVVPLITGAMSGEEAKIRTAAQRLLPLAAKPSPLLHPPSLADQPEERDEPAIRTETKANVQAAASDHRAVERPAQHTIRPVHAAGAVLLHPFLGAFFERLSLLRSPGCFRNADAGARAVLLTHYLATGTPEAPEPQTTLFKLLCGWPLADPVPRRVEPTAAERSEAEHLLSSVITHWGRLGKTSPSGLRDGFLTRPGRLQDLTDRWRLVVEPHGIDVLLDRLPWALTPARTPFMRSFIEVRWR